jgi:hypothetical protein
MKPRLTRAALEAMLDKLAADSTPVEPTPGAMCYMPAPPMAYREYDCPTCHGITNYRSEWFTGDEFSEMRRASFDVNQVAAWRRLVLEIRKHGLDIAFAEESLCAVCRPDAAEFKVVATLRFPDAKDDVHLENDAIGHLDLLLAVVKGEIVYLGERDEASPLRHYIPQIRKLVGLRAKRSPRKPKL